VVNREVRKELLDKLGVSRQALAQRVKRLKTKYGPMTTDEAVYIIAHQESIDLGKYLPLDVLDRIRSLIPREVAPQKQPIPARKGGRTIKSGSRPPGYPLVKNDIIKKTIELGAETFPRIVVLEHSIRNLIRQTLSKVQRDWWPALIPDTVLNNVARTIKKESKYTYRKSRGNDKLLYCNFSDLKAIILHNSTLFSNIIIDFKWFETWMDEVYMARNGLAHSIILSEDDINRIDIFYNEWATMLESAKIG
jgi:hypothetical protein